MAIPMACQNFNLGIGNLETLQWLKHLGCSLITALYVTDVRAGVSEQYGRRPAPAADGRSFKTRLLPHCTHYH